MKILAIADRQPKKAVAESVANGRPELIVTLGDLDLYSLRGLGPITDIPKIGVYGNHCSGNYFEELGIENMHLRVKDVGGVLFGGFEGSIRYKAGEAPMYTEEEAVAMLKNFPYVDIMLCHSPPRGIHDEDDPAHRGFEALRTYVENKRPKYLLHGHTYVSTGTKETVFEDTKIVHVYADQFLTLAL